MAAKAAEPKVVQVDVREKLKDTKLEKLDFDCVPACAAVSALATKAAALSKKGVKKPFVFMEMAEFLPHWFPVGTSKAEEAAGVFLPVQVG